MGAVQAPSQERLLWEGVSGRGAATGRGEISVLRTCLLAFQRVLFIRLRERDGFKISLIALWAALVNRIQLLRPGRSSPNFFILGKMDQRCIPLFYCLKHIYFVFI